MSPCSLLTNGGFVSAVFFYLACLTQIPSSLSDCWSAANIEHYTTLLPGRWSLRAAGDTLQLHSDSKICILETQVLDGSLEAKEPVYVLKLLNLQSGKLVHSIQGVEDTSKSQGFLQALSEILAGASDEAFSLLVVKSAPKGVLLDMSEPNLSVDSATWKLITQDSCPNSAPCVYGALMGFLGWNLTASTSPKFHTIMQSKLLVETSASFNDFIISICKVSILDTLISNFDRSPRNCFWEPKGTLFALDNGAGFYKYKDSLDLLRRPTAIRKCMAGLSKEEIATLSGCRRLRITREIVYSVNVTRAKQRLEKAFIRDPVLKLLSCRFGIGNDTQGCAADILGPTYANFFQTALKTNLSKYTSWYGSTCQVNAVELIVDYFILRWSDIKASIDLLLKESRCHHNLL